MTHNGPAIKGVFVAEGMEAVGRIYRIHFNLSKAVESEAWRGFCRHGTILIACRRNRGTNLLNGRKLVTVQNLENEHWCSIAVQI